MKKQIIVIHGGGSYHTYKKYIVALRDYKLDFERLKRKDWKENLAEKLGDDFEVILPKMPNSMNARYKEWEIMFNKLLPFLNDNVILIGHSLGGIFLVKYLSKNQFPKNIKATFLVATPYGEKSVNYSLCSFSLPKSLTKFQQQGGKIFIYYSKDDPIVPLSDFNKYKKALPKARGVIFKDRGHFIGPKFAELIKDIKSIIK